MRITKKYAGASCIGKQVFQLADNYYEVFQENERELQRLEALFLARINGKGAGMAGKRSISSDTLTAHPSIYETANPGRTPADLQMQMQMRVSPPMPRRATSEGYKKRQGQGAGRTATMTVAGSPGKYRRSSSDSFYGASSSSSGGEAYGTEEYGYAYDPEGEDDGIAYPRELSFPPDGSGGLYSNASLGRRVLSAPNLSELSLSSWKEAAYRPLPADSLREMFSQPISGHCGDSRAGHAGSREPSLLPAHVYSVLGTESGRYAGPSGGRPAADSLGSYPQEAGDSDDHSSLQDRKRSFSAMAPMDFETLSSDDIAAGTFDSSAVLWSRPRSLPSYCYFRRLVSQLPGQSGRYPPTRTYPRRDPRLQQ
jgi:hypothetical protein